MAIKVLRLIEYTYKDEEKMSEDMLRWTQSYYGSSMTMRSAVLQPEAVEWVEPEAVPPPSFGVNPDYGIGVDIDLEMS